MNKANEWFKVGKLHREDGPAVEITDYSVGGIYLQKKEADLYKKIISCDIKELPLFMGDKLSNIMQRAIEKRFQGLKPKKLVYKKIKWI